MKSRKDDLVCDQVWDQINPWTSINYNQVEIQVEIQVEGHVWDQIWGQIEVRVSNQIRDQIYSRSMRRLNDPRERRTED
jgi:hypothetical protein